MKDGKKAFNVLASVEKHIEALKPLLPRQAIVCIGEYPIKLLLQEPFISKIEGTLPVLIEKSSDDLYKWVPANFNPYLILGFEDAKTDTHFWYNAMPYISKDDTLIESLKKKSIEPLQGTMLVASVWDGIGSASLPTLTGKLKASNIRSLAIAILPSKVQPADAHFNAFASLKTCSAIDGSTMVPVERDYLEGYEGVDRKGSLIKGNAVLNYLINFLLGKETFVAEISELSRIFNAKMFTPLLVSGASYRIFGSLENMLNTALLKPLLPFDLSSSEVLYVLFRMPSGLKDKLPRAKMELAIANWFKDKASLKSIYITEPIYVDDQNDRVDIAVFIGGFGTKEMFSEYERKIKSLKDQAVAKGYMTDDWQVVEEKPAETAIDTISESSIEEEIPLLENEPKAEEVKSIVEAEKVEEVKAEKSKKPNRKTVAKPKKAVKQKRQKVIEKKQKASSA